jgi:hypothetical protein
VLAFGTQFAGSKPAEAVAFFPGEKKSSEGFLGGEVKACPMSQIFHM